MTQTLHYYDHNAAEVCERYEAANLTELHALLLSLFREGKKVLELGCGSGRDGAFLIRNGCDWFGIEGSEAMLLRSISLHPELAGRIALHDLRDPIAYPDACFEGVFSFAALMHLDAVSAKNALNEVYRVLAMGAPFLMSVPLKRTDVDANGYDRDGRFFLPWDDSTWEEALSDVGFSVGQKQLAHDSMGREMEWVNFITHKETRVDRP